MKIQKLITQKHYIITLTFINLSQKKIDKTKKNKIKELMNLKYALRLVFLYYKRKGNILFKGFFGYSVLHKLKYQGDTNNSFSANFGNVNTRVKKNHVSAQNIKKQRNFKLVVIENSALVNSEISYFAKRKIPTVLLRVQENSKVKQSNCSFLIYSIFKNISKRI